MHVAVFLKRHATSIIFLVLTVLVSLWIFSFSSQDSGQSSSLSRGVCRFLAELFVPNIESMTPAQREARLDILEPIIRKVAHFCVFGALGVFSCLTAVSFNYERGRDFKLLPILACALYCLIYACSDEFHQLFVSGRYSSVTDVLIDFSGSVLGIGFALLLFMWFLKVRRKRGKI